jgi:hypothetical protein
LVLVGLVVGLSVEATVSDDEHADTMQEVLESATGRLLGIDLRA